MRESTKANGNKCSVCVYVYQRKHADKDGIEWVLANVLKRELEGVIDIQRTGRSEQGTIEEEENRFDYPAYGML